MLSSIPVAAFLALAPQAGTRTEVWTAHLDVAGDTASEWEGAAADLTFGLELARTDAGWTAFLVNEPERIEVPRVEREGDELLLGMAHYDSRIRARLVDEDTLVGEWEKVRGKDRVARVPFRAERGAGTPRRLPTVQPRSVAGRWSVDFSSDDLLSVAIFEQAGRAVRGTFLTHTGDYRFLAGEVVGKRLTLSCFDGAHAFLFEAEIGEDGGLSGSFRSGNWWHETWTAVRDDDAALGDAFDQTTWQAGASLADYAFPDTAGELRSLLEPDLFGRATILQLFGSWCPNCHDETRYLVELHERYADRGLRIIGLAFELTGERERDTQQLAVFRERYGIPYPLLLAGTADKGEASRAFPAIDRLRSYPTTIFFDANARVRALHSGFAGPATGAEHAALRHHYEALIEDLLVEPVAPEDELWTLLREHSPWGPLAPGGEGVRLLFKDTDTGNRVVVAASAPDAGFERVTLRANSIWLGGRAFRVDREHLRLVDPLDYAAGFLGSGSPRVEPLTDDAARTALASDASDVEARIRALVHARGVPEADVTELVLPDLEHPNVRLRREALRTLLALHASGAIPNETRAALGEDPDPIIRRLIAVAPR